VKGERDRSGTLAELSRKLGYHFNNQDLLFEAVRHSSYVNEMGSVALSDNEKLEFLGDAVLDLAIGHILIHTFPEAREGDLSKYRAAVVNEKGLCQIADQIGLGRYILLGKGEELTQGRKKASILADSTEALIGALYLDAGFDKTKEIIEHLFLPLINQVADGTAITDYKSRLQEYTQRVYQARPDYRLVRESGQPHAKVFRIAVHILGKPIAQGEGGSKKQAEQRAAREAFHWLKEQQHPR
jgi:ribonuclease-3